MKSLLLALPAALFALNAAAEPPSSKADGPLRSACPRIDAALQEALQPVALRTTPRQQPMRVQFKLNGAQISEIEPQGGSESQRIHVRRAVAALPCYSESEQRLSFSLALSRGG
ncbi:hypothetical protein [Roseateles violae]|uniref:Uncharacterized protein n=1 Tax=Roseateles violae TaxID=3058042 RepID=A0ABT8DRK2_9BURK|nr:hypothetical protein [Pelomonas sp. PFR6]MDN3918751.1 hypothetical protein [Pelomonas sp. PFR6]